MREVVISFQEFSLIFGITSLIDYSVLYQDGIKPKK